MSVISVYAIFPNTEEAERICRAMVEKQFAACVNLLGPTRSIYRWQGRIETADEVAAIFKTTEEQVDGLMTRIAGMHSYDVPCIVAWPIDKVLGNYADWVESSVG